MEVSSSDKVQHASAVTTLIFCTLFSFLKSGFEDIPFVFILWAFSLLFLYMPFFLSLPNYSERELRDSRRISILGSWFFVIWILNMLFRDKVLMLLSAILLTSTIVVSVVYYRKYRKREEHPASYHGALKKWKKFMLVSSLLIAVISFGFLMLIPVAQYSDTFMYTWCFCVWVSTLSLMAIGRKRMSDLQYPIQSSIER